MAEDGDTITLWPRAVSADTLSENRPTVPTSGGGVMLRICVQAPTWNRHGEKCWRPLWYKVDPDSRLVTIGKVLGHGALIPRQMKSAREDL